jgi:hypothetical protein
MYSYHLQSPFYTWFMYPLDYSITPNQHHYLNQENYIHQVPVYSLIKPPAQTN